MPNRRTFLKAGAGGVAATALIPTLDRVASAIAPRQASVTAGHPIDVNLTAVRRDRLGRLSSLAGTRVACSASNAGLAWAASNIQLHTRYTPSPDGVQLTFLRDSAAKDRPFESYRHNTPTARALGREEYGVIINTVKADRLGLRDFTLQGMAKRGIRPQFYASSEGSAGENCWMLPLLAQHVQLTPRRGTLDFSSRAHTAAFVDLMRDVLPKLDVRIVHASTDASQYLSLTEEHSPQSVALHGNPRILAALAAADPKVKLGDFAVVPLHKFLGISRPALFATAALQIGRFVDNPAAAAVFTNMLEQPARDDIARALLRATPLTMASASVQALQQWHAILGPTHDFAYYQNLPHLSYLTDDGFLARLVIDMLALPIAPDDTTSAHVSAARYLGAETQQRWSEREHAERLHPTANSAAPRPLFV